MVATEYSFFGEIDFAVPKTAFGVSRYVFRNCESATVFFTTFYNPL